MIQAIHKIIKEEQFVYNEEGFNISCSFSLTESRKTDSLEDLLHRLNTAYNKAKVSGNSKIFVQQE